MLRTLIHRLVLLPLGAGLAFALLAFGCEGPNPALEVVCGGDGAPDFARLTVGVWLILGTGLLAVQLVRRARTAMPPRAGLRVAALLSVLATGSLIGAGGAWITGDDHWYVAIPAALAAGWWFLANPLACQPGAADLGVGDGPETPQRGDKER